MPRIQQKRGLKANLPSSGMLAGELFLTTDRGTAHFATDATGRWFRYSFAQQSMVGFGTNVYPSGAAVVGDTAFDVVEPETNVRYLHMILNTSSVHMRCMVI